jgi:hypothetical protein
MKTTGSSIFEMSGLWDWRLWNSELYKEPKTDGILDSDFFKEPEPTGLQFWNNNFLEPAVLIDSNNRATLVVSSQQFLII